MGKGTMVRALGLGALAAAGAAAAFALPASSRTQAAQLNGSVSNPANISGPTGTVTAGLYEFVVSDSSTFHNFHLSGPGVDMATTIPGTGSVTWPVTLTPGTYTYVCDAHPSMNGSFTVVAATTSSTVATSSTQETTTEPETTTAPETTTTAPVTTTTVPVTTTTVPETTTTEPETTTTEPTPKPVPRPALLGLAATGHAVSIRVRVAHRASARVTVSRRLHVVLKSTRSVGPGKVKFVVRLPKRSPSGLYRIQLRLLDPRGPDLSLVRTVRIG